MANVPTTPTGYHTVTTYLTVKGAADAIAFYKAAFGAAEVMRLDMGPNLIGHAEVMIGDSHVMLSDEFPEMGVVSPKTLGGTGSSTMIYTEDCDAMIARAVAAGAKVLRAAEDQFYGDRMGQIEDPFGHRWSISTHLEDLSVDEIKERMAKQYGG
ncbi:MAG: VOC family protein [Casimicrobium sp.]